MKISTTFTLTTSASTKEIYNRDIGELENIAKKEGYEIVGFRIPTLNDVFISVDLDVRHGVRFDLDTARDARLILKKPTHKKISFVETGEFRQAKESEWHGYNTYARDYHSFAKWDQVRPSGGKCHIYKMMVSEEEKA